MIWVWICQQQNIFVNSPAQRRLWDHRSPYNLNHCLKLSWWRSVLLIIVYSDLSFFYKNSFANNTAFSLYYSPSKESDFDLPSMGFLKAFWLMPALFVLMLCCLHLGWKWIFFSYSLFNTEGCSVHSPLLLERISNSLSELPPGDDNESSQ